MQQFDACFRSTSGDCGNCTVCPLRCEPHATRRTCEYARMGACAVQETTFARHSAYYAAECIQRAGSASADAPPIADECSSRVNGRWSRINCGVRSSLRCRAMRAAAKGRWAIKCDRVCATRRGCAFVVLAGVVCSLFSNRR